jgi:hypothetical protein
VNAALFAIALSAAPALASAQGRPLVTEGRQLLDEGRFEDAVERFTRAEAADDLGRDDLVLLLEGRALAAHALRDLPAMNRELARLLVVAPAHRFDPTLPPDLAETFESLRATASPPLAIETTSRRTGDRVVIESTAAAAPEGLARTLRIAARVPGSRWQTGVDHLEIAARPSDEVEYFAELVGPGGAVIASAGSADRPERRPPDAVAVQSVVALDEVEDDGVSPWVWVGIGAGVAVAAAVAITLAFVLSAEAGTQPSYPFLR